MNVIRKVASININAIKIDVKRSLMKEFILTNDLDVVLLQEVAFDDFSFLPSHNAFVNRCGAYSGTAILVRKAIEARDCIKSSCGRIISLVVDNINFVNFYGHAGSQYKAERDDLFEVQAVAHLSKVSVGDTIVGGDFNCILEENDCRGSYKNICRGLRTLTSQMNLNDIEITLKGTNKQFTFFRNDSASRIDRFYATKNILRKVQKFETKAIPFSDHHAIQFCYRIEEHEKLPVFGRGYWKINNILLQDEDTTQEFSTIYESLRSRRKYSSNFAEWWCYDVKNKIKQFYKSKSFQMNQGNRAQKNVWYSKLRELEQRQLNNENVEDEISKVKSEIVNLENQRLRSISSKFQPSTMLESEKISIYQVSKIVKRQSNQGNLQLKNKDGNLCDQLETKKIVHDHFKELFAGNRSVNTPASGSTLNSITKTLSPQSKQALLRPITDDELLETIKNSTMKKAPGPDGITYEFYLVHYDTLKDDLLKLFNGIFNGSIMPLENFTDGIVTLIPKTGNKFDINNYRPISLLNADYKIFCKIIAKRLKACLEELIEEGQTAGIKNKSCTDNLDIIRTLVIKAQQSKKFKFALLSIDLEKAFDMVCHNRLWETLSKYEIPDQFVSCLKQLYRNAASKIIVNGFLTQSFKIGQSVRQGCPLSMMLFSLYIEPLIRHLDKTIKGIFISNRFVRVLAFADDLTLVVRSDQEFDEVMEVIKSFSIFAEIKLNYKKSGYIRFNNCLLGPQLIAEKNEVKILGVVFGVNYRKVIDNNYSKVVQSIIAATRTHMSRRLNLFEKIIVLNTYLLSKLWYIAQVIPPSNVHLAQIKKTTGYFLWGNHRIFKIERSQLYLHLLKGGLNLIDPETQCKSLFVRGLLFKNNTVYNHYLMSTDNLKGLSLNTQRFIQKAKEIKNQPHLVTNKQMYDYMIDKLNIEVKVEKKYPQIQWEQVWENINQNFLTLSSRSTLYEIFNDIIPNKIKLFNNISNTENYLCDVCGKPDNNIHRIINCTKTKIIWKWVTEIVKKRFRIQVESPHLILYYGIAKNNCKMKAALWLVCEAIAYNVKNHKNPSLFIFQKEIRDYRWNNYSLYKKHFKKYLNIC